MDFRRLLPIGSVVLLKKAQKRLMIFGIGQTDENSGIDYDYIGVAYPEGSMGRGSQFLFNHDDIEQVYFTGYEDEERYEFIEKIQRAMDEQSEN